MPRERPAPNAHAVREHSMRFRGNPSGSFGECVGWVKISDDCSPFALALMCLRFFGGLCWLCITKGPQLMSNVKNRCPRILSAWCACWPSPIITCCLELVFEFLQLVGWSPYAFSIYLGSRAWPLSCQFENFHFRCKYWRELKLRFMIECAVAADATGVEKLEKWVTWG